MHFRSKKGERNGTDNTHFIPNNFFTIFDGGETRR